MGSRIWYKGFMFFHLFVRFEIIHNVVFKKIRNDNQNRMAAFIEKLLWAVFSVITITPCFFNPLKILSGRYYYPHDLHERKQTLKEVKLTFPRSNGRV